MKQKLLQLFGWLGMILILGAYFLVSFDFLSADSIWYQGMNIVGSIGIVFETLSKKDYQPAVLNIAWILIAIISLMKILL